jgi:hypothetical protein
MTAASDPALASTRRSLHAVAELVLAGPQYAETNEISLRSVPGGFATTHTPDLRVVGTDAVGPAGTAAIDGHTPASLAAAIGVEATSLSHVYKDGSGVGLHDVLDVSPDAAAVVASAYAAGDAALRALSADETPILWPEHFDIGISVDEVNYGVSPGDSYIPVPYAYVGPWSPPPQDDYWNASFGRALPLTEIDDLVAFFTEGRDRVAGG